ncbi:hypothetical protein [Vibrio splendidus]|uniref:hypothetical protein n=1 Tax=Vibrio splendidus TaxID=29497 RepID=UPI001E429A09|nr:hypothetical protein [Vibrio splendidus]MCC4860689.1 hypothetical protein [Vibrio splendidus]
MRNIEIFNLITAEIFARSYAVFPNEIKILSDEIALSVKEYYPEDLQLKILNEARESVFSTVDWLGRSGYIFVKDQHDIGFGRVTLTPKTLSLLNQIPSSLQHSMGNEFIKQSKALSSVAVVEAVKLLFSNQ